MIAVDTNLLVYAHREDSPFHDRALEVLCRVAEEEVRWAIPWPCVHEFLSVVTHPKIYVPPTPMQVALDSIRQWVSHPACTTLSEGPDYLKRLEALCLQGQIQGPVVHDARIAALCQTWGVRTLYSADRDFSRFGGLRVMNPLVED